VAPSQADFLRALSDRLLAARIPFMVSGSLASSFHGHARATNDMDFVIDPDEPALLAFVRSLPDEWYVSEPAARDALHRRSMFNVIDTASGWKADLIVRKDRPFSEGEMRRSVPANVQGTPLPLVSAEDSILSKLEWAKDAGSHRQYQDALGVAVVRWDDLDREYLKRWATELGVAEDLDRLLRDAAALRPREP
jgi:hypothetical protein